MMAVQKKEESQPFSPAGQVASWARQGVDSFFAAQKILLDLTAQQNALFIGMVRERVSMPRIHPGKAIAQFTDKSVKHFATAGKILLDLAADETALVMDGVTEGLPLPVAAATVANIFRHRVDTFIGMEKNLLDAAAEQTHAIAESYQAGKGLKAESVSELARKGIEGFVESEKKFLDLATHEVTTALKGGAEGHKPSRERSKVFTELAREGVNKYVDAQKKLLELGIDQLMPEHKTAAERAPVARKKPRTSLAELTEKSVRNIVAAQKSLMDIAIKPPKAAENGDRKHPPTRRKTRPEAEPAVA